MDALPIYSSRQFIDLYITFFLQQLFTYQLFRT